MSHGWDTRTVIETAMSHRWPRRIQRESPVLAAARNVLKLLWLIFKRVFDKESLEHLEQLPYSVEVWVERINLNTSKETAQRSAVYIKYFETLQAVMRRS